MARRIARGLLALAVVACVGAAVAGDWLRDDWPDWPTHLPPQAQRWLAALQPEPDWRQLPQGDWLAQVRQRGSLVVAVRAYQRPAPPEAPTPPEPDNFDAGLARFIAQKIGVGIQLVGLTPAASGKGYATPTEAVDLVIAGAEVQVGTISTVPTAYTAGPARLVVLRGSAIHTAADLRQRSVCLQRGSSHARMLAEHYGAVPRPYASGVHAVYAFMGGECDVLAEDAALVERLATRPEWRFYRSLPEQVPADHSRPQLALTGADAASTAFVDDVVRYWRASGALLAAREQRVGDVSFELIQLEDGLICHG